MTRVTVGDGHASDVHMEKRVFSKTFAREMSRSRPSPERSRATLEPASSSKEV